jgi:Domain of unknown function (DUF4173)
MAIVLPCRIMAGTYCKKIKKNMIMNREVFKTILTIAGALIFNIVFWQEKIAINMVIFDAFVLWSVFYLYPSVFSKPGTRWLLALHLITLAAVVIHNTVLSKLACCTTLLLLMAFAQYLHRSVWYAAGSALMNVVLMVVSFFEGLAGMRSGKLPSLGLRRVARFIIIPLMIAGGFLGLYSLANTVFMNVVNDAAVAVGNFLSKIFTWFSLSRFGFLLAGIFVTGALLLKANVNFFSEKDSRQSNSLWRKKNNMARWKQSGLFDLLSLFMGRFANGMLALRNENTVGIISLAMLNGLLCCINIIDIVYVWFGFTYHNNINLSAYVHEGAGLLIFSIVLAMLVLLFFFRGNLNFYKKNRWLRYGAYLWILQNIVLVISVLIRDYYYFVHMGMAYKRIGVVVFLLLVMAGLVTVFIKIHYRKTNYYLLRVNAWFAIVILVISSCIHWDEWIANSNLSRKGTIPVDVNFLLSLSDKTLPIIEKNKEVLDTAYLSAHGELNYLYGRVMTPVAYFEMRKKDFFEEQKGYSWLSWNKADAYIKKHLHIPAAATVKPVPEVTESAAVIH